MYISVNLYVLFNIPATMIGISYKLFFIYSFIIQSYNNKIRAFNGKVNWQNRDWLGTFFMEKGLAHIIRHIGLILGYLPER